MAAYAIEDKFDPVGRRGLGKRVTIPGADKPTGSAHVAVGPCADAEAVRLAVGEKLGTSPNRSMLPSRPSGQLATKATLTHDEVGFPLTARNSTVERDAGAWPPHYPDDA